MVILMMIKLSPIRKQYAVTRFMHSQTDCKCDCMPAAVCMLISFRLYIQPSTSVGIVKL